MMDPKKPTNTLVADGEPNSGDQVGRPAPLVPPEKRAESTSYDWMAPSLRRMYDDVLNEPIPESFVELLKQLHDQQKRRH
jgi:hypothetical protein